MNVNPEKCHLLTSSMTPIFTKIEGHEINNSKFEKLLCITIDNNLNFNTHLDQVLTKAWQKVNILARIAPYRNISKRKLIMNSFFIPHFNYCPLSGVSAVQWMIKLTAYMKHAFALHGDNNTSSFENHHKLL